MGNIKVTNTDTFLVTITTINQKGKTDVNKITVDGKNGVARIMLTFKPRRNYEVVEYLVTPYVSLFEGNG